MKSDVQLPGSSYLGAMAAECGARAGDARVPALKAAVAAYNATRAHNALGEYEQAARLGRQWLQRVPNSEPALDKLTRRRKQQTADRFRQGRVYEVALALHSLGMRGPGPRAGAIPGQGGPGAVCTPAGRCLAEAQTLLDDAKLLAPFERSCERASFGEFLLLRGLNRKALAQAKGPDWEVQSSQAQADLTELLVRDSCKDSGLQGRAKQELVSLLIEDGERHLGGESAASLPLAVRAFETALQRDRESLRAQLGLGRALLAHAEALEMQASDEAPATLRAEQEPAQLYGKAYAAFAAAERLAAAGDLLRGEALEGKGQALLGLAGASPLPMTPNLAAILGPPPPPPPETQRLAREAAGAAEGALAVEATEGRHLLRAAALQLAGDDASVEREYVDALRVDLSGAPPSGVRSEILLEIGKFYLGRGDRSRAEAFFQAVVRQDGGRVSAAAPFRFRRKAEAFYGLSVIRALDGDAAGAASYAERAVLTGGAAAPFWQQRCLTHLARSGRGYSAESAATACVGQPGALGRLFTGLHHLRVAQDRPHYNATSSLNSAKIAFDEGRGLLGEGAGLNSQPNAQTVRILLEFGYVKALSCAGISEVSRLDRGQISWAAQQFEALGVQPC